MSTVVYAGFLHDSDLVLSPGYIYLINVTAHIFKSVKILKAFEAKYLERRGWQLLANYLMMEKKRTMIIIVVCNLLVHEIRMAILSQPWLRDSHTTFFPHCIRL